MMESIQNKMCCKRGLENEVYNAQTATHYAVNTSKVEDYLNYVTSGDKTVVMAGHYYIRDPENPNDPSRNAQKTFESACNLVSIINQDTSKRAYLHVMLNDVELPVKKEDMAKARQFVRENFSFPEIFKKIMQKYNLTERDLFNPTNINGKGCRTDQTAIARDYNDGAASERRYVNRFNRNWRTSFAGMFPKLCQENFNMNTGEGNGIPEACTKAITQYYLDLHNNSVDNSILIVPGCSKGNAERATKIARQAIPTLKSSIVYLTPSCYDISTERRYEK